MWCERSRASAIVCTVCIWYIFLCCLFVEREKISSSGILLEMLATNARNNLNKYTCTKQAPNADSINGTQTIWSPPNALHIKPTFAQRPSGKKTNAIQTAWAKTKKRTECKREKRYHRLNKTTPAATTNHQSSNGRRVQTVACGYTCFVASEVASRCMCCVFKLHYFNVHVNLCPRFSVFAC